MCADPLTIAMVATAVSGAVSAGSQVMQGNAAAAQGRYEQKVANNNAAYEREAAADAEERGKRDELRKAQEVAQVRAMQVAAMAANGFDTDFGTGLDMQNDTLQLGMQDQWTIRENAGREVRGHVINASNYTASGQAALARGKAARRAGYMGAAGTVLSSAASVFSMGANPAAGAAGGSAMPFEKLNTFKPQKMNTIRPSSNFGGMAFG